jgi:hypothetical protein
MKVFASARYFVIDRGCPMDEADYGNEEAERRLESLIKHASKPLVKGSPGDCDLCGEWSGRLVEGCCAPCRDRYKIK